jgi:SAM-dependent methyltransferase
MEDFSDTRGVDLKKEQVLEELSVSIEAEITRVKNVIEEEKGVLVDSEDFDLRGELYRLAFEVAPGARQEDLRHLFNWMKPKFSEKSIDLAAGTGFVSIPLAKVTKEKVYAVDPSEVQLQNLDAGKEDLPIETVTGSFADQEVLGRLGEEVGRIDIVTSYGGLHHAIARETEQREIFKNIAKALRSGGRMVVGDVGAKTPLSTHFEESVKQHCLTGHEEKWLDEERLSGELIEGTDLELVRVEHVPVKWFFDSERQLALFMKCLHAYDMSESDILDDLQKHLGYQMDDSGLWALNWPMLFFEMKKY